MCIGLHKMCIIFADRDSRDEVSRKKALMEVSPVPPKASIECRGDDAPHAVEPAHRALTVASTMRPLDRLTSRRSPTLYMR